MGSRSGFRGLRSVGKVYREHGCGAFNRVPAGLNKVGLVRKRGQAEVLPALLG